MARTTTRRRKTKRDDTWVVKLDEFHPNPQTAAKAADRLAKVAALRSTSDEMARVERRFDGTTGNERRTLDITLKALRADKARIEQDIIDMDKDNEEDN